MNGINVPKEYEHMLRKERSDQSPEYTEAIIRDYIKAHPKEVITGADFVKATGVTMTGSRILKLIAAGRITRKQVKDGNKGFRYSYEWHDSPVAVVADYRAEGPMKITALNLPEIIITPAVLKYVADEILERGHTYSADQVQGLLQLRRKMKEEMERVDGERQKIIDERNKAHGN